MTDRRGRRELPEDLELMPPGAALGSLLATVDRSSLSDRDRVRLLRARNRQAAHVQAELFADMYAISLDDEAASDAACDAADDEPGAPSRYPWAASEVAFALTWTETAAGARLEQARQLVEDLPQLMAALRAGLVDMPKVLVICELASWLDDVAVARRLVDEVLDRAPRWTTGQLRATLRQLVLAVDPQAARRRCVTALKTRRVETMPNPDGTGEVWGRCLPPQDAAAAWERLTAIARAAKAAGDDRTMDQLRADALLDLLIGEGIAVGQPVGRHLAGLPDADGPPAHLATIPGAPPERPAAASTRDNPPVMPPPADWDPAWPTAPDDRLTADRVQPHPAGPPVDVFDDAGRDYDGDDWPADWPGRWAGDPAVIAAATANPAAAGPAATGRATTATNPAPGAMPAPRRGVVELLLPLTTATGQDDLPGELVGWGPVIADIARQIAADQHSRGQWRYSTYNRLGELEHHGVLTSRPASTAPPIPPGPSRAAEIPDAPGRPEPPRSPGSPVPRSKRQTRSTTTKSTTTNQRRPSAATVTHVRARNRTCTAPGCRIPARNCDLDHTKAWADGGPTTETNLGPSCRRHHRFKHESGATLWQLDPGDAFVWTTRRGMQYLTKPEPPLLQAQHLVGPAHRPPHPPPHPSPHPPADTS